VANEFGDCLAGWWFADRAAAPPRSRSRPASGSSTSSSPTSAAIASRSPSKYAPMIAKSHRRSPSTSGRHDHVSPFWRTEHRWAAPPRQPTPRCLWRRPATPSRLSWPNPRQSECDHGPLTRRSNNHHADPLQPSGQQGHAAARRGIHDVGSTEAGK